MSSVASALGDEQNRLVSLRRSWHWRGENRAEIDNPMRTRCCLDARFTCSVALFDGLLLVFDADKGLQGGGGEFCDVKCTCVRKGLGVHSCARHIAAGS